MPQQPNDCKHSKFKLSFKLKQHTPIIHFQSDQKGATLRATELKPKLDRFLIEHFTERNIDYKKFLINGQEKALNYSIKIIPNSTVQIFNIAPIFNHYNKRKQEYEKKPLPFPTFFASIDKEWAEKSKTIKFLYTDTLSIEIRTFNLALKEKIEENINIFFMTHNFGMRQSKGFGSFSVENSEFSDEYYYFDIDLDNFKKLKHPDKKWQILEKDLDKNFIDANSISKSYKEFYLLFKVIELFYNTLRSGINIGDFYFKSLMFLYAKEELETQWDKRLYKKNFLTASQRKAQLDKHTNKECNDILKYETDDKYLLRDCLGLATIQEYLDPEKFTIRHPNDNPKDMFDDKEIEPNNIKRLQSPLLIKPIKLNNIYRVYIIPKDYPDGVFEENITVLKASGNNITKKLDNLKLHPDFNLQEFLDFAFNVDIKKHLEKCETDTMLLQSQILSNLYAQLNKQANDKRSQS
jgi:hypothetical protein